jgi:three-Cys-motif partner protein
MGINNEFFEAKKPAAVLKHAILTNYVPPFVSKVGSTAQGGRVVVMDPYAGPGEYADGAPGSPLLMYEAVKSLQGRTLDLLLVERDPKTYARLREVLERQGVPLLHEPYLGDAHERLDDLLAAAQGAPLFAFIDPYGLGITFKDLVEKVLSRPAGLGNPATEVLLNFSSEAVRRIAGRLTEPDGTPGREATLSRLDEVCGGTWWRGIATAGAEDLGAAVAYEYLDKICKTAHCSGWRISVKRAPGQQSVYNLVYLTRHPHGMHLFGEAASLAAAKWRRAVTESGTLDDDQFFNDSESRLEEEWHNEIVKNVREILEENGHVTPGSETARVYGSSAGLARTKHLRRALRELHGAGELTPAPTGKIERVTFRRL